MTISELKKIWEKEKEHYKKSEVGSGVQDFVYSAFQVKELFGLKKGLKSTEPLKRKNEFLKEHSNKAGLADAVIFINSEILVPVEVEKLEKAQTGEWQILKYRTAYDKKYGILTDGYEWRFYYGDVNDNQHFKYTIDEILESPNEFNTFWQEYVKPDNYYLSFFQEIGQKTLIASEKISVDDNRDRFFEDITEIIRSLKDKLLGAGYFNKIENKLERHKKATEIAYSYLIQFILFKTLVDNYFDHFLKEFEHKTELIHSNLNKQSYNSVLAILEGMSDKISENIYKPFHSEQEFIIAEVKDILHGGEEKLINVAPFLDIFVFIRKYNFANVQNDIFGTIYENYLKELYEQQNLGQYFTDPNVVNFMLEEVGYTKEEVVQRSEQNISIIDPACGSGTFLYSAVREIVAAGDYTTVSGAKRIEELVRGNVFGIDIAEFPLYLAEMSILMKMLPSIVNEKYNNPIDKKLKLFVTEDSLAEFVGEIGTRKKGDKSGQQVKMALEYKYEGFMRDERDLDEMKRSVNVVGGGTKTIARKRFDYVIANPPYIGYNESSKMGVKIFNLLKDKTNNVSLNDIYGWNLHSVPENRKKYSPKPNLYAFFLALGFALLKEGGKLCFIVPQSLLAAGDLDVLRYKLANDYTIEKIYTFAANLFIGRGTHQKRVIPTSSLVIVCSKNSALSSHSVECVHLPNVDLDVKDVFTHLRLNRRQLVKMISQKKFRENIDNWNFIKWDDELIELHDHYKKNTYPMDIYYDHKKSLDMFKSAFYIDGGAILDENLISESDSDGFELFDYKNNDWNKYSTSKSDLTYPRKVKLAFPQGSQGAIVFEQAYKIIWRTKFANRFQFCDRNILLQGNQSLLISANSKVEILFLFACLNSPLNIMLLEKLVKNENEKNYLLAIKTIKRYIRIPKITSENRSIKDKIITLTDKLLGTEEQYIGGVVDINNLVQRFDNVIVKNKQLVLHSENISSVVELNDEQAHLIGRALDEYFSKLKLSEGSRAISLSELKSIRIIDQVKQKKLKEDIDQLVYKLYKLTAEEIRIVEEGI